ncbi:hypothetical protein LG274_06140 [Micrococcus antarcticus]|uniref:hypothetical protein n=1 Tax=Micrococcus antarcticus TaxID=86171 RepID=UPI0038501CEF
MAADPRPHRPSSRAPRRRALAGIAAASALVLAGCGADDAGDGGDAGAGPSPGASVPAAEASSAAAGLDLGDRPDQRMAEAAALRAATFGFIRQQAASEQEIAAAREDSRQRQADGGRTTVEPASCKPPLAALDFSPILLDQEEVTRVDVGADSFSGTGTVEVATLDGPGRQQVEQHLQTANSLLADCRQMDMTVREGGGTEDYRLLTRPAELSDGSPAQSGLVWQRSLASEESPQLTAQVLTAVAGDQVVMVSFSGQDQAGERQFTLMAEEILAAALRAG